MKYDPNRQQPAGRPRSVVTERTWCCARRWGLSFQLQQDINCCLLSLVYNSLVIVVSTMMSSSLTIMLAFLHGCLTSMCCPQNVGGFLDLSCVYVIAAALDSIAPTTRKASKLVRMLACTFLLLKLPTIPIFSPPQNVQIISGLDTHFPNSYLSFLLNSRVQMLRTAPPPPPLKPITI